MSTKPVTVWFVCSIVAAALFITAPTIFSEQSRPAAGQWHVSESEIAYQAISFDEAIRRVQAQSGGRILSAEIKNRDGRVFYRIKVLTPDGRVQIYWVDAETGQII